MTYNTQRRGRENKKRNPAGAAVALNAFHNGSNNHQHVANILYDDNNNISASPGDSLHENEFQTFMCGKHLYTGRGYDRSESLIQIGGGVSVLTPHPHSDTGTDTDTAALRMIDPNSHGISGVANPDDWRVSSKNVIVDDIDEYPSLTERAASERRSLSSSRINPNPWSQNIPSPVRRAAKESDSRSWEVKHKK